MSAREELNELLTPLDDITLTDEERAFQSDRRLNEKKKSAQFIGRQPVPTGTRPPM